MKNKFYKQIFCLCCSVFIICNSYSQNLRFGNEWIDFGKRYFKIRVTSEGMYRINYSDFTNAGISAADIAQIKPNNFQLFYQGNEQPIFVSTTGSSMGSSDYIEFYGNRNDGVLDKALYTNPADQPHSYRSFYTDTAMYFICWGGNTVGKRYTEVNKTNYASYTAEAYFKHTELFAYWDFWYRAPTSTDYLELSDFTQGEGYMTGLLQKSKKSKATFKMLDYDSSEASPVLETEFYGKSQDINASNNIFHYSTIKISKDNKKFKTVLDTTFGMFDRMHVKLSLPQDSFHFDSMVYFMDTVPIKNLKVDNQAIAYISLTYPRKFNLRYSNSLSLKYEGKGGNETYVNFTNLADNGAAIYDVDNGYKIIPTLNGNYLQAIIPGASDIRRLYVCGNSAYKTIEGLQPVTMAKIDTSAGCNYLMVCHKKLMNSSKAFRDYRAKDSINTKPLLVWIDELYDQFYYGYHSPLAIRHFADYMLTYNNKKPEHLLLLGKGYLYYFARTLDAGKQVFLNSDLIPTWGYPGSDVFLTSGLDGTQLGPGIATGRIPAYDDMHVYNYLNKIVQYEGGRNNTDDAWHKKILHLGGGINAGQAANFKAVLSNLQNIAEGDSLGASVTSLYKYEPQPVTNSFAKPSQVLLNQGLGFTYYFGHGSTNILEVDLGDTLLGILKNQGKLPVMFFAGCQLGNCFDPYQDSKGEEWLFAQGRGAIGWMANTAFGFSSDLEQLGINVYTQTFKESYGKTFGQIAKKAIENYQNGRTDEFALMHSRQLIWEGDPALKFFSPSGPDYYLPTNDKVLPFSLSIYPQGITAVSDSFAIKIDAYNKGKSTSDSVILRVKRILPNGQIINYPDSIVLPPKWKQEYYYWIKSKDASTQGPNTFEVTINPTPNPRIIEYASKYGNNKATLKYDIPATGANIVFPYNYAIVNENPLKLQAQQSNSKFGNAVFIFQLDTNYQFKSNWNVSKVNASQLANVYMSLLNQDSTVYYWRVRLEKANGIDTSWQTGSFTYIKTISSGWGQMQTPQMFGASLHDIFLDNIDRRFLFSSRTGKTISMFSTGTSYSSRPYDARAYRIDNGGAVDGNLVYGWAIMALNPNDETIFNYKNSKYNAAKKGIFRFDTRTQAGIDAFVKHIDTIPTGYKVFIMKGDSTGDLSAANQKLYPLKQAFKLQLGGGGLIDKLGVKENWPFLLKGTKDGPLGSAREQTADLSGTSPLSPEKQIIGDYDQVGPKLTLGDMTSELIGPAKKWQTFYKDNEAKDNPSDSVWYDIYLYDTSGNEIPLIVNTNESSLSLDTVDANKYPNLRVKMYYNDDTLRTPQQIKYWLISYQGVPEGAVITNPSLPYVFIPNDSVSDGDSITIGVAFQNISRYDFDSLLVNATWTAANGNNAVFLNQTLKPLLSGDTIYIKQKLPTKGKLGKNTITISFNPDHAQAEQYSYNNQFSKSFYVFTDLENPILDVTFDGQHIMNNDIISPNPSIQISVTDENKHFLITDPSSIKLWITYPGQVEKELDMTSGLLTFSPADAKNRKAKIIFTPTNLPDGLYQLRSQAYDVVGNASAASDYRVTFRIINKPSITRIYPYPNPFTTKCHFVFTLTGSQLPDNMHIQIMTITGIVVKEIFKEDLGAIHIGNNITDYAWDGTDQYGDRLANGVYLYRVNAKLNGKEVEITSNNDDQYFKNGIGKIVILR
ncbi:MAG: C25 family cysteine peptidase [Bacteroidota bacterium]|nr:C25 family cysteine peptidase [Bacteroidota bacterium]